MDKKRESRETGTEMEMSAAGVDAAEMSAAEMSALEMDAPEIRDFKDRVELKIVEARPGYARGEIELKPWHMNRLGIVHGGVLFTIADTVSGTAAVTGKEYSVSTINGSINYMRAGKNTKKIIAEAHAIKDGKSLTVCECKVYNDREEVLAVTAMTFFHLMPKA